MVKNKRRRLVFLIDPLPSLKAKKDSSIAMMEAAMKQGWLVGTATADDVYWQRKTERDAGVYARVTWIDVSLPVLNHLPTWWTVRERSIERLAEVDAVLMRLDPPVDERYLNLTWLLSAAEREGAKVVNRPAALRDHNEKLALIEFSRWIAPTLVTNQITALLSFLDEYPDAVAKPLNGMGGRGVFRLRSNDDNKRVILETLTDNGHQFVMLQRYIPEIRDGDKRILLIAGQAVPYAVARLPKEGEHRGNLAAGGQPRVQPLSKRDQEIVADVAPRLHQRGLFLVGLDVIGDYLTEINVTSPTGFREVAEQTDCDPAKLLMDALDVELPHRLPGEDAS